MFFFLYYQRLHTPSPPAGLEVLVVHFLLLHLVVHRSLASPEDLEVQLDLEALDPPKNAVTGFILWHTWQKMNTQTLLCYTWWCSPSNLEVHFGLKDLAVLCPSLPGTHFVITIKLNFKFMPIKQKAHLVSFWTRGSLLPLHKKQIGEKYLKQ